MAGQVSRTFPLLDQILVERSLRLPEKYQGKVSQAIVGDKVLLPEYGDTRVVLDDEDYFI
ncbi:10 kDa heat shock protein, mitochondrial-like [Sturnira hondurensis]|uniref:10 kDa heat shock protein, mitochondrial-like n=1 Tax=Sturnira hondurensis TaxID=192404 RepID=UPI00187A75BA|nr:10 kDa heat shock protein, mitochondrial-like [Sturnira hondurensis]